MGERDGEKKTLVKAMQEGGEVSKNASEKFTERKKRQGKYVQHNHRNMTITPFKRLCVCDVCSAKP